MGDVYGVAQRAEEVSANPRPDRAGIGDRRITSVIAAFIPARNAARVDPVKALAEGRYQALSAGENRRRKILAFACALIAAGTVLAGGRGLLLYAGYAFSIFAALLLTPALSVWISRCCGPY